VVAVGGAVVAENVAETWPAGTTIDTGTATALLLLTSETVIPPDGAAAFSVTVPVAEPPPPITDVGLMESVLGPIAITVTPSVRELDPRLAVSVTDVVEVTNCVASVAVPLAAPCAIVMLAGTDAATLDEDSEITKPPAGAAALIVTVAVAFSTPPIKVDGLTVSDWIVYGLTVTVVLFVDPYAFAVIVTGVEALTTEVTIEKLALVEPAAMETLAGTDPAELREESATTAPPFGAAAASVTVPVMLANPPITAVGVAEMVFTVTRYSWSVALADLPFAAAWTWTLAVTVGGDVVMVNVAVVCPAATVTDAGTTAAGLLLVSETT
jgi:hypothetical protein